MKTETTMFLLILALFAPNGVFAQVEPNKNKLEEKLFNASQISRLATFTLDAWTTVSGPNHLQYDYCPDGNCGTVEMQFSRREVGIPGRWISQDNLPAVVAVGVASQVFLHFGIKALYHKGGIWRKIAIGLNAGMAGAHLRAAIRNNGQNDLRHRYAPDGATNVRVW